MAGAAIQPPLSRPPDALSRVSDGQDRQRPMTCQVCPNWQVREGQGVKDMSIHTDLIEALETLLPVAEKAFGALTVDLDKARGAIAAAKEAQASPDERAAALAIHKDGDELEIDEDALASRSDEGTWVQAWVWVPAEDHCDHDFEEDEVGILVCTKCGIEGPQDEGEAWSCARCGNTDQDGSGICVDCGQEG